MNPNDTSSGTYRPVVCNRCDDDDTGPWIPIGDGHFLCEACWESRTP